MELCNPEDRGFDSERLQRIDRFLDETYLDTGRLAMMQLLVSRDSRRTIPTAAPCATTARRCAKMRCSASPA